MNRLNKKTAKNKGFYWFFPYKLAKTRKVDMNFILMSLHAAIVFGMDESRIFRLIQQKNSSFFS